jgi:hypothetical protein
LSILHHTVLVSILFISKYLSVGKFIFEQDDEKQKNEKNIYYHEERPRLAKAIVESSRLVFFLDDQVWKVVGQETLPWSPGRWTEEGSGTWSMNELAPIGKCQAVRL